MKFTIGKWFAFEAAHSLPHLPEGHKCRNLHGHSYRVQLVLSCHPGDLDDNGFVTDYGDLSGFQAIIDDLDHKTLDDFITPSTAEELAQWLYLLASDIYSPKSQHLLAPRLTVEFVEVRETEKTFARYGRA